MKYLKRLKSESEYSAFLGGGGYIEPHIVTIEKDNSSRPVMHFKKETPKPPVPEAMKAGDVAYWNGSKVQTISLTKWGSSLGTPVGVVVVPEGFAPDGKTRIMNLTYIDKNGNSVSTVNNSIEWSSMLYDSPLPNYTVVPITDNVASVSGGSPYYPWLPSDNNEGVQSASDPLAKYMGGTPYVPSPYLNNTPNPDYYNALSGGNAFSDFNGLNNTQTLRMSGPEFIAASACGNYRDGVSNLQWYLPAMGELGYLVARYKAIAATIRQLGGSIDDGIYQMSSTEFNTYEYFALAPSSGFCEPASKELSVAYQPRPFAIIE